MTQVNFKLLYVQPMQSMNQLIGIFLTLGTESTFSRVILAQQTIDDASVNMEKGTTTIFQSICFFDAS